MSEIKHNVNGAWKKTKKVYVKVASAWRQVKKIYVKAGGAWKLTYRDLLRFDITITGKQYNYSLRNALIGAGWDGMVGRFLHWSLIAIHVNYWAGIRPDLENRRQQNQRCSRP